MSQQPIFKRRVLPPLGLHLLLIKATVSAEIEMRPPSENSLLNFRMALSRTVLIAMTRYLLVSLVDLSSGTSDKFSATFRVDSSTSQSVWSNLHPGGLVYVFLCTDTSTVISIVTYYKLVFMFC